RSLYACSRQITPRLNSLLNLATRSLNLIRSLPRSTASLTKISNQVLIIRATFCHDTVNVGHRYSKFARRRFKTLSRLLRFLNLGHPLAVFRIVPSLLPKAKIRSFNNLKQPTQNRLRDLSHTGHAASPSSHQRCRGSESVALKRASSARKSSAQSSLRFGSFQSSLSHIPLRGRSIIRCANQTGNNRTSGHNPDS